MSWASVFNGLLIKEMIIYLFVQRFHAMWEMYLMWFECTQ